jgi:hypothetical protein
MIKLVYDKAKNAVQMVLKGGQLVGEAKLLKPTMLTAIPTAGTSAAWAGSDVYHTVASFDLTPGNWVISANFDGYFSAVGGQVAGGVDFQNFTDSTILQTRQYDNASNGNDEAYSKSCPVTLTAPKTIKIRLRMSQLTGTPTGSTFTMRATATHPSIFAFAVD